MSFHIPSKSQQRTLLITFITIYKNGSKLPKTSNNLWRIYPSNTLGFD